MSDLISMFQDLQSNYADEFIIHNLSQLAVPLLTPVLRRQMILWNPFEQTEGGLPPSAALFQAPHRTPTFCYEIYSNLKQLLYSTGNVHAMGPYDRIVWETWMPAFRRLLTGLSMRECGLECVDLLKTWTSLLAPWMLENILEQMIMPKLTSQVDVWNPLTDTVPIHQWIHPWLPLLKDRLDGKYTKKALQMYQLFNLA